MVVHCVSLQAMALILRAGHQVLSSGRLPGLCREGKSVRFRNHILSDRAQRHQDVQ